MKKDLLMQQSEKSLSKRLLYGRVISDKMNKTVTVLVESKFRHPLYKKYVKTSTTFHVHDSENVAQEGDKVSFFETKPYSKTKCWCIAEVINH